MSYAKGRGAVRGFFFGTQFLGPSSWGPCAISNGVDRLPDRLPNVLLDAERLKRKRPQHGGRTGAVIPRMLLGHYIRSSITK